MNSLYSHIILKNFFYRLLFFAVVFLLIFLSKDLQLMYIRHGLTGYNIHSIAKYFSLALPEYLVLMFPFAFVLSFVWTYSVLKRKNYLLFASLRGIKKTTFLSFGLFLYIPVAIGLFFFQEYYTKETKKKAQIIMEDHLLKLSRVRSGLDLYKNAFYKIDDNRFLYFSRFVTDPPNDGSPYLTDVLHWVSQTNSEDFYVLERASVQEKNLILKDPLFGEESLTSFDKMDALIEPRHFHFFYNSGKPSVNIAPLKNSIVITNFTKENIQKNQTVHYSSLTLAELFKIQKVISSLGMSTEFLWILLAFPFLHLFILPVGVCILTQKFFTSPVGNR